MQVLPSSISEICGVSLEFVYRVVGWNPSAIPKETEQLEAILTQYRHPITGRLPSEEGLATEGAVMTSNFQAKLFTRQQSSLTCESSSQGVIKRVQRECEAGIVALDMSLSNQVNVDETLENIAECLSVLSPMLYFSSYSRALKSVPLGHMRTFFRYMDLYVSVEALQALLYRLDTDQIFLRQRLFVFVSVATRRRRRSGEAVQQIVSETLQHLGQPPVTELALEYLSEFSKEALYMIASYEGQWDNAHELANFGVLQLRVYEIMSSCKESVTSEDKAKLAQLRQAIEMTKGQIDSCLINTKLRVISRSMECLIDSPVVFKAPENLIISNYCPEIYVETYLALSNVIIETPLPQHCLITFGFLPWRDWMSEADDYSGKILKLRRQHGHMVYSGYIDQQKRKRYLDYRRLDFSFHFLESAFTELGDRVYFKVISDGCATLKLLRIDLRREYSVSFIETPVNDVDKHACLNCVAVSGKLYLYDANCFVEFDYALNKFEDLSMHIKLNMHGLCVGMELTKCIYFVSGMSVFEIDVSQRSSRQLSIKLPVCFEGFSAHKLRRHSTGFFLIMDDFVIVVDVVLGRCELWERLSSPL
jgi:hypothetical protein